MNQFVPGLILGLREGLEAFLIISIIYRYLLELNRADLKTNLFKGTFLGVIGSLILGGLLFSISDYIGGVSKFGKIWEGIMSLVAVLLVGTFIKWMIDHGQTMVQEVKSQVSERLTPMGLFLIALVLVGREGTEIALFTFAGKYTLASVFTGVFLSLILTFLIYKSIVKIKIATIFKFTLVYLILQAAFLLGYGIHESLSALKAYGILDPDHFLLTKAFDFSKTILNHKEGILGMPMLVLFGWYSKPEVIQLIAHLSFLGFTFNYWKKVNQRNGLSKPRVELKSQMT